MSKRVLIITNIPNPYRIPLFNLLSKELNRLGDKLLVAFGAKGYKRRKWQFNLETEAQFDYKFLNSKLFRLGSDEKVLFTYGGLYKLIRDYKPDVTVVTGFSPATLKLFFISLIRKINYIIWSGSINTKGRSDSLLRKFYRKLLLRRAASFIAYGTLAKEYLLKLGAEPGKIFISFNTTDIDFYKRETERKLQNLIRPDEIKHLLYIGHLSRGKRVDLLINIASELKILRNDFIIDIVGDGPENNKLKSQVEKLQLSSYIRFHGFRQQNEIPEFLTQADLFLFPSEYDIWGLVLVEAMAAGVPCIASVHAGASQDLIIENETGFKVDFEETESVVKKVNSLLSDTGELKRVGNNAKIFISENINFEKSAEGFIKAIYKQSMN